MSDAFRDVDTERLVTGHVLTWPEDLSAYWTAGLTVDAFTDGDLRFVWEAIAALDNDGVSPDERTVRNVVMARGVPAPFLSGLVDGVPRQRRENIVRHVDRLSRLRRCRHFARGEQAALAQLVERPDLIDNGFLAHRRDALQTLEHDCPEPDLLVDDVAVLELEPPECLVDSRFVTGTLAAIIGPPGSGKTFLAIDLSLSVALGRPWLGSPTLRRGTVVYVAAEGVSGLRARIKAWKIAHDVPLDQACGFRLYPRALNLLEPAAVATFLRATRRLCPVLVIIDTLARCMIGGDENSAGDMGRVIAAADQIRLELGAVILFLHHTTKAGGTERGSSALRGALDTLVALNPADDLLSLTCEKQKDLAPFTPLDLRLDLVAGSCVARLARHVATREALSPTQQRCLRTLQESFNAEAGASSAEWKAAMPDVNERSFYRALKVLGDFGYVRKAGQRHVSTGKCESLTITDSTTDTPSDTTTDIEMQGDFEL